MYSNEKETNSVKKHIARFQRARTTPLSYDQWLILYAFISSIRLQKQLTNPETLNQSKIPHFWQSQTLVDIRTRQGSTIGQPYRSFKYSVFNLLLNKVTDGALRILYGTLFQTVGAV